MCGGWIPCYQKPCEYSSELQYNPSEFCRWHKDLPLSFTSLNWGTYFNRVLVQGLFSEVTGEWEDAREEGKPPESRSGLDKMLLPVYPTQTYIICPDSPWGPALAFWAWASGLVGSLTNATLLSHGKGSLGGSCLSPSLFPKASTALRKVCQPNCVLLLCWGCHSEREGPVTIVHPSSAVAGVVWQSLGVGLLELPLLCSAVRLVWCHLF